MLAHPAASAQMTVHGLVCDMTAQGRQGGGPGRGRDSPLPLRRDSCAGLVGQDQGNTLASFLVAGGVDYGEQDTAIANAEMIRSMNLIPVVYAGNVRRIRRRCA